MRCVAYVDGSFSSFDWRGGKVGVYGYGAYLLLENVDEPVSYSGGSANPEFVSMRNVAGELAGVMQVVTALRAELPQYDVLELFYDYEGIEKWVTGEWRAKNPLTQTYRDFMREQQKEMQILFNKVDAHTGVIYNERADKLAKKGVLDAAKKLGIVV